jgi:membrane fusion protein, multidrug efflux system
LAQLDDAAYLKTLEQTSTQYNLAKELFDRQSRLWEQKIGSEMQYLQAKTQKEALESALGSLEEQVDYMKIKSPINGTVEDLPLKVGMAFACHAGGNHYQFCIAKSSSRSSRSLWSKHCNRRFGCTLFSRP